MRKLTFISLILISVGVPAHAYIDPGAGSYFFQVALAAGLGFLYTMRVYIRTFWGYLKFKVAGKATTHQHGTDADLEATSEQRNAP